MFDTRNVPPTPVCQAYGLLNPFEDPETLFSTASRMVMRWAQPFVQRSLPPMPADGESPLYRDENRSTFCTLSTPSLLGARLTMAPGDGHEWITEVCLIREGKHVHFGTRQLDRNFDRFGLSSHASNVFIPLITKAIARELGLQGDGRALKPFCTELPEAETAHLYELIVNKNRARPVIVLSLEQGQMLAEQALVNPENLAEALCPLAHVFLISDNQAKDLTSLMGKEWSVYNGALRTYRPGLDTETDNSYRHPVATRETLAERFKNNEANFIKELLRQAAVSSLRDLPQDCVPSFAQIKEKMSTTAPALPTKPEGTALPEPSEIQTELESLRKENEALRKRNEGLKERLKETEQELTVAREEAAAAMDLAVEIEEGRQDLLCALNTLSGVSPSEPSLLEQWKHLSVKLTKDLPSKTEEIGAWAKKKLSGQLVLMPKVVKGIASSDKHPLNICHALLLLAGQYRTMCIEGTPKSREDFTSALRRTHLEKRPVPNPSAILYEGENLALGERIARTGSPTAPQTLELHFAFDKKTNRVVVGYGPKPSWD